MSVKNIVKRISLILLLIPVLYLTSALILTYIPVSKHSADGNKSIFISTNGVHLDIIIKKEDLSPTLQAGLVHKDQYLSFGWGDKDFYLNTPTWGDLTVKTAIKAMLLKSSTLMHVTRYSKQNSKWLKVRLTQQQLATVNDYLTSSFKHDGNNKFYNLKNKGYGYNDDFYEANGSYSCLNTCNSWVNRGIKQAGLKACLWTPFDFGVLNIYSKTNSR